MKKISPLLRKEKQLISLWLKIYFLKKNCILESHMLIYEITLGWLLSLLGGLKKVSQLGWFGTSTTLFPFLLEKHRIIQIKDQEGF